MTEEELRDTGRNKRIENEREHMGGARAFDTLVVANLDLVKTLRRSLRIFMACGIVITAVTAVSAVYLHIGQDETRVLIRTLDRLNCEEKKVVR